MKEEEEYICKGETREHKICGKKMNDFHAMCVDVNSGEKQYFCVECFKRMKTDWGK